MSPYIFFETVHRVEVHVPRRVFEAFGESDLYAQVSANASSKVTASGRGAYGGDCVEWGEAPTRRACEEFAKVWKEWILQWDALLRIRL